MYRRGPRQEYGSEVGAVEYSEFHRDFTFGSGENEHDIRVVSRSRDYDVHGVVFGGSHGDHICFVGLFFGEEGKSRLAC